MLYIGVCFHFGRGTCIFLKERMKAARERKIGILFDLDIDGYIKVSVYGLSLLTLPP